MTGQEIDKRHEVMVRCVLLVCCGGITFASHVPCHLFGFLAFVAKIEFFAPVFHRHFSEILDQNCWEVASCM